MLTDILHGIQTTRHSGHEVGMVIEMGLTGEEELLKLFIFFHNLFQ